MTKAAPTAIPQCAPKHCLPCFINPECLFSFLFSPPKTLLKAIISIPRPESLPSAGSPAAPGHLSPSAQVEILRSSAHPSSPTPTHIRSAAGRAGPKSYSSSDHCPHPRPHLALGRSDTDNRSTNISNIMMYMLGSLLPVIPP